MAKYLPNPGDTHAQPLRQPTEVEGRPQQNLGDLKVFWGPEACRLEYLVHLIRTGRIKDEYRPRST
jgi:hypothetical protein